MNNNLYFNSFANCIPVKGAVRSIICDLQRQDYDFIPNELYEILTLHSRKTIGEVKQIYHEPSVVEEYFEFLLDKEYIFLSDNVEEFKNFPPLNLQWDEPAVITNAIIDINASSNHDFKSIFSQLIELGCKHLQIRAYRQLDIKYIHNFMLLLEESIVESVEIILPNSEELTNESLIALIEKFPRIQSFLLHSAKENKIEKTDPSKMGNIIYIKQEIDSSNHCGIINPAFFTVNIKSFTESVNHNSCLNRKIGIDTNGDIKNCPSINDSYGNIKSTSLLDAIEKDDFKKYWNTTKDQIDICKDCEFRYICTDCRAFLQNSDNELSKPLKCEYNPYEL